MPHRVGAAHDHAPGGLAEDVREPGARHDPALHQLGERLAGADRGELVGVSDEHDVRPPPDRPQERHEELEIRHRGLVDDQEVGLELVDRRPLVRHPPERAVDGGGVAPGRLRHPAGGAAGRRHEHDRRGLLGRRGADQPDRRGLAGAGSAGDDREPGAERGPHRRPLLGRGHKVGIGGASRHRQARLRATQPPYLLRELGLERRGLRAVRPDLVRAIDFEHQLAGGGHLAQHRRRRRRAAEQRGLRGELTHRQAGRAVLLRLGEHVHHPCARPGRRIGRHAARARDPVGRVEADPEHARELVRPAANDLVRALAVVLGDPRHEPGEPVRREQQVQLARGAQGVPRLDRLARAPRR